MADGKLDITGVYVHGVDYANKTFNNNVPHVKDFSNQTDILSGDGHHSPNRACSMGFHGLKG